MRHFRFSCFSSATNVYQHKHHHLPTLRTYGGVGGHVYVGLMLRWNGNINISKSVSRIELTRGMTHVAARSYLLTDGAKAYPSLAKKYGLKDEEVNHAGGQ